MLNKLKEYGIKVLLICPDGLTVLLTLLLMEILYRVLIHFGLASSGLELILTGVGFSYFLLLLFWRLHRYRRRK